MGLTLHYELSSTARSTVNARNLIVDLRNHAQSLPFESVSEIIELKGESCRFDRGNKGDPDAWLKVQTIRFLTQDKGNLITAVADSMPSPSIPA